MQLAYALKQMMLKLGMGRDSVWTSKELWVCSNWMWWVKRIGTTTSFHCVVFAGCNANPNSPIHKQTNNEAVSFAIYLIFYLFD